MKAVYYTIDKTKFKRTPGIMTESKDVTNYLKTDVIGRKIVLRQLRELGFDVINTSGKWFVKYLELI